jgi:hypothetical protein
LHALRNERGILMTFRWCVGLAALMVGVAVARTGHAAMPCLGDIQKFCSETPSGGDKIQACLKTVARELAAICLWDIERFCGDVAPGSGRIAACLQQHTNDLGPTCKDQIKKASKD